MGQVGTDSATIAHDSIVFVAGGLVLIFLAGTPLRPLAIGIATVAVIYALLFTHFAQQISDFVNKR